jgi:chromosomal replication initiation ATPase DnaA
MAEQLPLKLPVDPGFTDEDFLVSRCNEAALGMVERYPDWPVPLLVLSGPEGSGKTHLARIWQRRSGAHQIEPGMDIDDRPLVGVIEDADRGRFDEAALFHLVNRVQAEGGALVFTARKPVSQWGIRTPDLLSRLRLALDIAIEAPDDEFLRALLVKLFVDRQMIVSTSIIAYMLPRMTRSCQQAIQLVEHIDHLCLARKSRPTRSIVAEALGIENEE